MSVWEWVELTLGVALGTYAFIDFLFTTIGANTYFFVSHRLARGLFRVHRLLPDGRWKHHAVGPLSVSAVALWWIGGLAGGWAMIFHAIDPGIVESDSGVQTGVIGALSHAGHLLSTLGGGITEPANTPVALLGVTAAVTGMVVLTLSVSFILSTTQTVLAGRSLLTLATAIPPDDERFASIFLPDLATLVSSLNSAPFALFYSHPNVDMRLPGGLARLHADTRGETRTAMSRILGHLALIERVDGPNDIDAWAELYELSPRETRLAPETRAL